MLKDRKGTVMYPITDEYGVPCLIPICTARAMNKEGTCNN